MIRGKWIAVLCTMFCIVFLFGNQGYSQTNVLKGKPAYVSSWDTTSMGANGKGMPGSLAVDGDSGTRWATDWMNDVNRDSGWIYIDLQGQHSIDSVVIKWETAGALHYAIQVANFVDPLSQDSLNLLASDTPWTTVAEITDGLSGETRAIGFTSVLARQIRVRGYSRTTTFGYSMWEFQCIDPTLAAHAVPAKSLSRTWTEITPAAIRFFAPAITGCKLYDVKGRCIREVSQQGAPSLSLDVSGVRGSFVNGVVIARLASKNGISTHRLTIAR
jgi:hypothetical protein